MSWQEELCIISGDNRSWEQNNISKTVIELWCRSKSGHSVLLLVNGLRPYLEIFDPNTNSNSIKPTLSLDKLD